MTVMGEIKRGVLSATMTLAVIGWFYLQIEVFRVFHIGIWWVLPVFFLGSGAILSLFTWLKYTILYTNSGLNVSGKEFNEKYKHLEKLL